jgi:hypothetical protein
MSKVITLELEDIEVGQVLDGLEKRAEAYESTALWFSKDIDVKDIPAYAVLEEVNSSGEAASIAAFYRAIIKKIQAQV